jgi:hypothetical protein
MGQGANSVAGAFAADIQALLLMALFGSLFTFDPGVFSALLPAGIQSLAESAHLS